MASPLWEGVAGLSLLAGDRGCPAPYAPWARRARQALDRHPGADARALFSRLPRRLPSFLLPPPSSAHDITGELETLCAVPEEAVLAELHSRFPNGVPEALLSFARSPASALTRYAELMFDYWTLALAPHWPAMRSAVEEEVLAHARILATEGAERMLGHLAPRLPLAPGPVSSAPHPGSGEPLLVVVPLLLAHESGLTARSADGSTLAVAYQARGIAVLMDGPDGAGSRRVDGAPPADRLALLVGRGRAAVLRALVTPGSTTSIAAVLGLAASTVSEHLAALTSAGLVQRHRVGRRVMYELDRFGLELLDWMEGGRSAA
ncbi:ArsR family transcriptional regulator [Streptomyces sp. NBC_00441]|uniref:ArsR family transcriptional regulator n=1 Tax=Streptomyces sp. NBC_00441 TaxID=2975742 RepID=UPI002E2A1AA3|nr:ArsR family transcriptional regulator [Streptomyces sp. NBC_00441]